jgi:hypothetical protein
MKESQFLGTLLPSSPDFLPIEQAIRGKYNLPEISPDWYGIHPAEKR